ncbi:MAG: universal stress protein [Desulfobulbaceae bacterium]|jgi:nucleotide-binding universal stress UspA family protein|nr:universal stress protein [Desulfobulbaceae bacterium]
MFAKIFVALETKPAEHEILSCMGGLRSLGAREAHLAYFLTVNEAFAASFEVAVEGLRADLGGLKEKLEEQGFKVEAQAAVASSAGEINHRIQAADASLVVVGAPPGTLAGELLFGGVPPAILHHQVQPTLVYRLRGEKSPCIGRACDFFSHILFPSDFSANAQTAFALLERIMESADIGRITLLHVQERERIEPHLKDRLQEFTAIDQERLDSMKQRLAEKTGAEIDTVLRYGMAASELLKAEEEICPSLVVMGSQGRGLIKEVFLGSVSHTMARRGASHLLLVPMAR